MKLSNVIFVWLLDGPKTFEQLVRLSDPFIDPAQAIRTARVAKPNGNEAELNTGKQRLVKFSLRVLTDEGWVAWENGQYSLTANAMERLRNSAPRPTTKIGQKTGNVLSIIQRLWLQGRIDLIVRVKQE